MISYYETFGRETWAIVLNDAGELVDRWRVHSIRAPLFGPSPGTPSEQASGALEPAGSASPDAAVSPSQDCPAHAPSTRNLGAVRRSSH